MTLTKVKIKLRAKTGAVIGQSQVSSGVSPVDVPDRTSQLINDSDFTTNSLLNEGLAKKTDLAVFNDFRELFDSMFEKVTENGVTSIRAKYGLWTEKFMSVRGLNPDGSAAGTGASFGLLTDWSQYVAGNGDALGADLGVTLREAVSSNTNAISLLSTRMSALEGKEFVTLNTTQEITGQKTHKGNVIISNLLYFKEVSRSNGIYLTSRSDNGALQFSQHNNYIWQKNIGNVDIDGNMTMNSFIKSGGTASQFLKADGSVDSNSYALASALGNYVKKSGDTMTGALTLPTINIKGTASSNAYITADNSTNVFVNSAGKSLMVWDGNENTVRSARALAGSVPLGTADVRWSNLYATTINVSSTALVSNLNADLLDGLHHTAFARADQSPAVDLNTVNGIGMFSNPLSASATTERHYPINEAGCLIYCTAAYSSANQIYGSFSSNRWFARGGAGWNTDNPKTSWREFAFTDSNVASATRLQGTYSLWGQSFFGNNVSGNMTGVGSITFSYDSAADLDAYGNFKFKANGNNWNIFNSSGNALVRLIHSSGNLGIGCVPEYKLDINGATRISSFLLVNDSIQSQKGITVNRNNINKNVNATAYWYGLGLGAIESGVTLGGYYGLKIFTANGKYTMLQNGNHGINTDSPTATLDVNGTGLFRGNLTTNATLRGMDTYVNQLFFSESTTDTQVRPYLSGYSSKFNVAFHKNGVWQKTPLMLDVDGNMELTGVFYATKGAWSDGYMSARGQNTSSDLRLKTDFHNLDLDIRDIASAPCVEFTWRKDGARDLGSIAQHFERINPLFTPKDPEGKLTLQYGKTALLYLIPTAKMVLTHEDRIATLERENRELRQEITRLQTITNN
ncbi:MAG: tail fiber domain-containing protein [Muribaculaceae bacterium]|nr:tail fiber domain-containing protein [Muribaculaceae bacterium]